MDHSTPKTWRQKEDCSPPQVPGITPIKPLNESPEVVPPSVFESSEEGSFQGDKGRTYMSNELRGSRISLLKAETEEEYDQSCSKEVAMLLKSSAVSGCIIGAGQVHPVDSLRDNYFSTKSMRERTKSLDSLLADMDINQLSDWSNDSFDKKHLQLDFKVMNSRLLLGAGAGEDILSQPATPGTPGAKKRLFSPEKKTPRGRPRKFSTAQMQSSSLRKNLVSIIPDEQGQIKHTAGKEVVQVLDQKPAGGEIILLKSLAEGISKDISRGRVEVTGHSEFPAEGMKKDISCGRVAVTGIPNSNAGMIEPDERAWQTPETPSRKGNIINSLMGVPKGSQYTPRRKRKYTRRNTTVDKLQMKIPQLLDQNHQKKSDGIEANKS